MLLVLLAHAHRTRGFPDVPALKAIGRYGVVGVDLFFVISGFLITTLLAREQERTGRVALGRFYARRCLRILPAYACYLAAVAVLQAAGLATLGARDWVAAMTYTVNFHDGLAWEVGHLWTLSVEQHFYLLWPAVLALMPRLGIPAAVLGILGCFTTRWVIIIFLPKWAPMAELWTFTRLDTILAGCLLALVARDGAGCRWLDRVCAGGKSLPLFGLTLAGSLAASGYSTKYAVGVAYSLNALCLCALLWS